MNRLLYGYTEKIMFEPNYTISARLLENIKKITTLIFELNRRPFPKVVLMELLKSAHEISAHASTSIEGNPLPLTEVKMLLKNHPKQLRDSEREVLNYNKALIWLDELLRVSKLLGQKNITPLTILKPHHQKILDYLKKHDFITDGLYATLTERKKPTRNQDLNHLIELGLLERVGKGRATIYRMK